MIYLYNLPALTRTLHYLTLAIKLFFCILLNQAYTSYLFTSWEKYSYSCYTKQFLLQLNWIIWKGLFDCVHLRDMYLPTLSGEKIKCVSYS